MRTTQKLSPPLDFMTRTQNIYTKENDGMGRNLLYTAIYSCFPVSILINDNLF